MKWTEEREGSGYRLGNYWLPEIKGGKTSTLTHTRTIVCFLSLNHSISPYDFLSYLSFSCVFFCFFSFPFLPYFIILLLTYIYFFLHSYYFFFFHFSSPPYICLPLFLPYVRAFVSFIQPSVFSYLATGQLRAHLTTLVAGMTHVDFYLYLLETFDRRLFL